MKSVLTTLFIFSILSVNAQIGKFLKDKIKENEGEITGILKKEAGKEAEKKRESLDSLDVMYAISFTDNSALVNITQKNESLIKGANFLLSDENEETTKEEELREQLMLGKRLYSLNQFTPATIALMAAKENYETENLTKDINYFETLANLGLIYGAMSRYDKANEYTLKALELRNEHLGNESPAYIASLNNRAVLYKDQGKYNEAEAELKSVIKLTKEQHGDQSVQHAIALNNMAMLYQEVGRYKEAEEIMQNAIKISGDNQNKRSRNHERFLTNLAILQQVSGNHEDAEATYLHVKSLQERFLKDKNNPELAHTNTNLASLYHATGRYDKVEPLLQQALGIYEKKFGKDNPTYATASSYLGNFYRGEGKLDEAEKLLLEVIEVRKNTLGTSHPEYNSAVEDLAVLYWKKKDYTKAVPLFTTALDQSLDFITHYFPPMSEAEKTRFWDKINSGFENFYAFTLEAQSAHPELLDKLFSYRMATKALLMSSASKLKKEIQSSNDESLKRLYTEWVDTKEVLANTYSLSMEEVKEQKIDITALESKANILEKELSAKSTVFREIITPSQWPLERLKRELKTGEAAVEIIHYNRPEGQEKKVKYAALIVHNDKAPKFIEIPEGELLEKRYFKYYHNAIQQKMGDEYSFNAFWKPVHDNISGISKIYLSPDGVYSQVNPVTFRIKDGVYVGDNYKISNLTTLREVESKPSNNPSNNAVLLGYPSYGSASVTPLPGTQEEIRQISQVLGSKSYKITQLQDNNATEDNIKKIMSPKILHVATHGYFMEDSGSDLKGFGINPGTINDNPMLRSGLILANVGLTSEDQEMQGLSSKDNGLLTAYEAINLDLGNTDLVVLSACETGLGEVKAGEGVYGLQRAFVVAGADAIIMSLWKVDDHATQLLMSNFYKEWLKGIDKLTAFKIAQMNLRKQFEHPYYWGAFVLVGK